MMNGIIRIMVHSLFRTEQFKKKQLKKVSKKIHNKRILEICSEVGYEKGKRNSIYKMFNGSNEFIKSDIDIKTKNRFLDISKESIEREFDVIICLNVMEHIYSYETAIKNIYNGLKQGGITILSVPAFYPIDNEQKDYWRFTKDSLREMLKQFDKTIIKHQGLKKFPFSYFIIAKKE